MRSTTSASSFPRIGQRSIFNPSFPYRLVHTVLAAYLTTAFVVGAVGAYHLLLKPDRESARTMFSMAMWMAALVAPIQIIAGDFHGLNTLEHQPAKITAMEGHYEHPQRRAAHPVRHSRRRRRNGRSMRWRFRGSAALILTHDLDGEVKGLKAWPPEQRPPSAVIFWSFRVMVGLGTAMAGMGLVSLWLRWRRGLYDGAVVPLAGAGDGAVGLRCGHRRVDHHGSGPAALHGLRPAATAESRSPIAAPAVGASLAAFALVYLLVFGMGLLYILKLMHQPPAALQQPLEHPIRTAGLVPGPAMGPAAPETAPEGVSQ